MTHNPDSSPQDKDHLKDVEQRTNLPARITHSVDPANDASIALLNSWLDEDATTDPKKLKEAEEDLKEFMRNMNIPRKQAGARLHYPEVEPSGLDDFSL